METLLFWQDLQRFGDNLAAVDDRGSSISYAELAVETAAVAARMGQGRELVLLEADNSVAWLTTYLALLGGGHVVLLVPHDNADARSRLEAQFRPTLRMLASSGYAPERLTNPPVPLDDDLALLLSTSGSTGSTKCVRLSHENIAANAASIAEYLELGPDERGAVNLPTHYSYGLSIVASHLHVGATMLFTHGSVIDRSFWAFLRENGATSFAGVPHVYDLLGRIDFVGSAPPTLRYFTQAGGRLAPDEARRFAGIADAQNWRFFIMYGQTEATARISYLPPKHALGHAESIGVAIPGGRLTLIDEHGEPVSAADTDGELLYEGPNVMMGYATGADELCLPAGERRLRTGDFARRDAAGLYRITGRKSRFIKIFGNRIGLDDVEAAAAAAGVAAIATGSDDKLLLVTRRDEGRPVLERLARETLKLPPDYFQVHLVDEYPLLASGKIDYSELKALMVADAPADAGLLAGLDTAPDDMAMTPRETEIAAIWRAALGVGPIGRDESFFDIGGDSLSAIQVMLRMERAGVPKAITQQIFEGRTIAEIAASLDASTPHTAGRTLRARTTDAISITRAILVMIVMVTHWGPFILERAGSGGRLVLEWATPLFRMGTPGFAIVFGLGLGFFQAPIARVNPARLGARMRNSLQIVGSGIALLAAFRAGALLLGGGFDGDWPVNLFWSVLPYYLLIVLTAPLWLRLLVRARYPALAALGVMTVSYALSLLLRLALPGTLEGWPQLGRLLLTSRFSYPEMLGHTMIGLAIGLTVEAANAREDLSRVTRWAGTTLVGFGVMLSFAVGMEGAWFGNSASLPQVIAYAGVTLLIFGTAFDRMNRVTPERHGRGLAPLLVVLGTLAFPIYVGHEAVVPAIRILEQLGLGHGLALASLVLLFLGAVGVATWRMRRLYYG